MLDGVDAGLGRRRSSGLRCDRRESPSAWPPRPRCSWPPSRSPCARAAGPRRSWSARWARRWCRFAHAGISVGSGSRHSASAVMSSPCGPPSENSSMAAHNASRISSAFLAPALQKFIQQPLGTKFLIPLEDLRQPVGIKKQPRARRKRAALDSRSASPATVPAACPRHQTGAARRPAAPESRDCGRR